jgi:hypothetical protein
LAVNDLSTADFTLVDVSGTIAGEAITGVSASNGSSIDVSLSTGTSGSGDLRLDVLAGTAIITDDVGNSLATSFTSGQVYSITRPPPITTTLPANSVVSVGTSASATVNGTVNPNNSETLAWFEWGSTTNYGQSSAVTNVGSGTSDVALGHSLTGLPAGVAYYFRLVASNSLALSFGSNQAIGPLLITPLGANPSTSECHTAFMDPGFSVMDPLTPFAGVSSTSGIVETNSPGAYTISYAATNALGATALATRFVLVRDSTPPVLTVNGADPLTIPLGSPFVDPGATASDACAGDLTGAIVVTGLLNTNVAGDYKLTYTVADPSGNIGSTSRAVRLVAPPFLENTTYLPEAQFQFSFTSNPGLSYGVLAATNLAGPLSNWTVICSATEIAPGQYLFVDAATTNAPQRFYRVRQF